MIVSGLSETQLREKLKSGDLCLDIFPFSVRVASNIPRLADDLRLAYADFPILDAQGFSDFHVSVSHVFDVRKPFERQARFCFDGRELFTRLPAYQAFTMLEWGLNWCIAAHCNDYLTIHAAVVERNGMAIIMPAPPGSGKSTLCTALISRGWRLLSDELALLDLCALKVLGMARPINLKNNSIDLIRNFAPHLSLTAPVKNTSKGTVALVHPPSESVSLRRTPAVPTWVVFPKYVQSAAPSFTERTKASTFITIAEQSFNYDTLHSQGFEALGNMVGNCDCFDFEYSNLNDAIQIFEQLLMSRQCPLVC